MKITQITNTANINFQKYKNQNVIGVLGSSQSSESIEKYMDMCSAAVKNAVSLCVKPIAAQFKIRIKRLRENPHKILP